MNQLKKTAFVSLLYSIIANSFLVLLNNYGNCKLYYTNIYLFFTLLICIIPIMLICGYRQLEFVRYGLYKKYIFNKIKQFSILNILFIIIIGVSFYFISSIYSLHLMLPTIRYSIHLFFIIELIFLFYLLIDLMWKNNFIDICYYIMVYFWFFLTSSGFGSILSPFYFLFYEGNVLNYIIHYVIWFVIWLLALNHTMGRIEL